MWTMRKSIDRLARQGQGGVYPYFICIGRQRDKPSCTQRAISIEEVEERVAAYYGTHVQLTDEQATQLRNFFNEEWLSCEPARPVNGRAEPPARKTEA